MTETEVRAIVRDEMAKIARENQAVASAEMAVFKANLKEQLEEHMKDMEAPESVREDMRRLMEGFFG